jgi:hypothetical protein
MKKFLVTIILVLFLSGNAYATCYDDLDVNREWVEIMSGKKDMLLTFKNKSNKDVIIAEMGLKTKSGTVMHSEKPDPEPYDPKKASQRIGEEDFYIKPFGVSKRLIIVSRLNLDVAGKAFYRCKYGTRAVVTDQTNSSSSSSSNSNSNSSKSKPKSETSGSSKSLLKKLLGKN